MSSIESLCLPEMCRTVGGQGPDCQHVSFDLEPHGSTGSKVVLPRKCPDLDLSWVLTGGPRGHWVKGELGETGRGRAEETTPGARGRGDAGEGFTPPSAVCLPTGACAWCAPVCGRICRSSCLRSYMWYACTGVRVCVHRCGQDGIPSCDPRSGHRKNWPLQPSAAFCPPGRPLGKAGVHGAHCTETG